MRKVAVFLGGFGFGNLGDEACLATSFAEFKADVNCVFTVDAQITAKVASFDMYFRDIEEIFPAHPTVDRVVIAGGGVGFMPSFRDNLDWALRCKRRGAEVVIHNIGIGKIGRDWADKWPYLVDVLSAAKVFSVRDFRSQVEVASWRLGVEPEVSFYPEQNHPVQKAFDGFLRETRPFLGISINNRHKLWEHIDDNNAAIQALVDRYAEWAVVPIVSTIHIGDGEEHDNVGFQRFVDKFGLSNRVLFRETLDRTFWKSFVTPATLKYLISRCECLISARKHNIIHSIGAKVPFVGLFEYDNDSIPRVYQTLIETIPAGSSLYPLFPK